MFINTDEFDNPPFVGLTITNPGWLSSLGKDTLCTFSKPVPNNVGTLMTIPRFGPQGWELPAIKAGPHKF